MQGGLIARYPTGSPQQGGVCGVGDAAIGRPSTWCLDVRTCLDTSVVHTGLHTAEWAAVVSAGFAAFAACASWASVWQNRRDRIVARTPDLHIEVQQALGSGIIRLHISNHGGPAKKVKFLVIEGEDFAYGHPAPTATFQSGESRLIETGLRASGQKTAKGFVGYCDMSGERYYACTVTGGKMSFRLKGWRRDRKISDHVLATKLYPEFDFSNMTYQEYDTIERSL